MIKRLAVIPARSGSKRIKNKNLQKIGKKSLLENCIEKCLSSKIFKEIHVSTDSEFFLNKIKKYKLKNNFLRPKILSDDKSPVFDVLKYVIKEYKRKNQFFDEVWLVFATNPFISKKHLLEASKLYNKNKNYKATILPDGSITYKNDRGSIHKIAAKVNNTISFNGWDYWHYEDKKKKLISINEIREKIRS